MPIQYGAVSGSQLPAVVTAELWVIVVHYAVRGAISGSGAHLPTVVTAKLWAVIVVDAVQPFQSNEVPSSAIR